MSVAYTLGEQSPSSQWLARFTDNSQRQLVSGQMSVAVMEMLPGMYIQVVFYPDSWTYVLQDWNGVELPAEAAAPVWKYIADAGLDFSDLYELGATARTLMEPLRCFGVFVPHNIVGFAKDAIRIQFCTAFIGDSEVSVEAFYRIMPKGIRLPSRRQVAWNEYSIQARQVSNYMPGDVLGVFCRAWGDPRFADDGTPLRFFKMRITPGSAPALPVSSSLDDNVILDELSRELDYKNFADITQEEQAAEDQMMVDYMSTVYERVFTNKLMEKVIKKYFYRNINQAYDARIKKTAQKLKAAGARKFFESNDELLDAINPKDLGEIMSKPTLADLERRLRTRFARLADGYGLPNGS